MSNESLWNDIRSILLIAKCVEIYVYDNSGDELTLVQLSQVVCIVWTD